MNVYENGQPAIFSPDHPMRQSSHIPKTSSYIRNPLRQHIPSQHTSIRQIPVCNESDDFDLLHNV